MRDEEYAIRLGAPNARVFVNVSGFRVRQVDVLKLNWYKYDAAGWKVLGLKCSMHRVEFVCLGNFASPRVPTDVVAVTLPYNYKLLISITE